MLVIENCNSLSDLRQKLIDGEEVRTARQEPCEDAISRQAVDILVDELARAISDERCCMSRGRSTATIMQDILDLPPVNPQNCDKCEVGNPCLYCRHEFEPQERSEE